MLFVMTFLPKPPPPLFLPFPFLFMFNDVEVGLAVAASSGCVGERRNALVRVVDAVIVTI